MNLDKCEVEILKLFKKPPRKAHQILKKTAKKLEELDKKWQELLSVLKELGIVEIKDGKVLVNKTRLEEVARYVPPTFSKPLHLKLYPDGVVTRPTLKTNVLSLHGKRVEEVTMNEFSERTHRTILWIKEQIERTKEESGNNEDLESIELEIGPPPAIDLSREKGYLIYAEFLHKLGTFLEEHPEHRYILRSIVKLAREFAKAYKERGEDGLKRTPGTVYQEIIKPLEDKNMISGGRMILRAKRKFLAQELALIGLAMENEVIEHDKTRYYTFRVRLEHQKDAPHLFPVHLTPSEGGKEDYAIKFNEKHPLVRVLREEKLI